MREVVQRRQTKREKICKLQSTSQIFTMCGVDTDLCIAICRIFLGAVCYLEQLHAQYPFLLRIAFGIHNKTNQVESVTGFELESGAREDTGRFRDVKWCVSTKDRPGSLELRHQNRMTTAALYHRRCHRAFALFQGSCYCINIGALKKSVCCSFSRDVFFFFW